MIYPQQTAQKKYAKSQATGDAVSDITATGLDLVVPGAGTVAKSVDNISSSLTRKEDGTYKSGLAGNADMMFNPLAKIKAIGSGDFNALKYTGLGTVLNKTGIVKFGETNAEKAAREAKENQDKFARQEFQRKSASLYPGMSASYSSYEEGGAITTKNIIPKGVLHSETNNIGSKGLPVLHGGKKVAEIEKEELTLTKNVTLVVEDLSKKVNKGDKQAAVKLGKFLHNQLTTNTLDLSKKFAV